MRFTGRSRELGRLRGLFDEPTATLTLVHGLPGVGKSTLVRRAAADCERLAHTCPPLPDPAQRGTLAGRIAGTADAGDAPPAEVLGDSPGWDELLNRALALASRSPRPFVLIFDDAHRLTEARSRFGRPLRAVLGEARARQAAFHVVLVGRSSGLPDVIAPDGDAAASLTRMHVEPLPLRAAAPHLPGNSQYEKVRAYGVFGGLPGVLSLLDTSVTVGTNVRRLALDDAGPLAEAPLAWLEREVQTPSRYVAILETLSRGEADWGRLHEGVPDLTRSGQVAPYLKRLAAIGAVSARRPLDASSRSRTSRYAITDPFLSFWFRIVLPWHLSEKSEAIGPFYTRVVRPSIAEHMEAALPLIARQHMTHDAIETLGANAREGGSLWGEGFDIPVAGTLTSGAAYYGTTRWSLDEASWPNAGTPLARLDAAVKETRYGFGRERRLRLLFTSGSDPARLRREVARRDDAELIGPAELLEG